MNKDKDIINFSYNVELSYISNYKLDYMQLIMMEL